MSRIRKVTNWANAFGHVSEIARLNLVASILGVLSCGWIITIMILVRSIDVVRLPGHSAFTPRFLGISVIVIFVVSLSIVFDRSVWRVAFRK